MITSFLLLALLGLVFVKSELFSDDVYNAAAALMEEPDRVLQGTQQDNAELTPGDYSFLSEDGHSRLTFTLSALLIREDHFAIHSKNDDQQLVAINRKFLPSFGNVAIPLASSIDSEEDQLLIISAESPLENGGKYSATEERAVFRAERVSIMSVLQDLSYNAPFEVRQNTELTGNPTVGSVLNCSNSSDREGNFDTYCGLNWDKESLEPKKVVEAIPFIIGGAQVAFSGNVVFEKQKSGLHAGIYVNADCNIRGGLDMQIKGGFNLDKSDTKSVEIDIPKAKFNVYGIVKVSFDITLGLSYGIFGDATINAIGKYVFGLRAYTSDKIFIGFENGVFVPPKFDSNTFVHEVSHPSREFKQQFADNSDIFLNLSLWLEPFIEVGFKVSVLGASTGLNAGISTRLSFQAGSHSNASKCTTFPFLDVDFIGLTFQPYFVVRSKEIKIPIFGRILESKNLVQQPIFKSKEWTIGKGCITDSNNLSPRASTTPTYQTVELKTASIKSRNGHNFVIRRITLRTTNGICIFKIKGKKSSVYYNSSECLLNNVNVDQDIQLQIVARKSGAVSFKVETINSHFPFTTFSMYNKNNVTLYSENYGVTLEGVRYSIPQNTDGSVSTISQHVKGKDFYTSMVIPPTLSGVFTPLFNVQNEVTKENYWTTGGADTKYIYASDGTNYNNYNGSLFYNDYLYRSFPADAYRNYNFRVTRLENNASSKRWLGYILSIGRGSNEKDLMEQLRDLEGDDLIDMSGTPEKEYPIPHKTAVTERSELAMFDLNFTCWNGALPLRMYHRYLWKSGLKYSQIMAGDVCELRTNTQYTFEYKNGKVITKFIMSKENAIVPVIYKPETNLVVKNQVVAASVTITYGYGKQIEMKKKNNYAYNVLHLEIPNGNTSNGLTMNVVVGLDKDDAVEWLAPSEYLDGNLYVISVPVNSLPDGKNWITLPFAFKSNISSVNFTLYDIFLSKKPADALCDSLTAWQSFSTRGTSLVAAVGCVDKLTGVAANESYCLTYDGANGSISCAARNIREKYILLNFTPRTNATVNYRFELYKFMLNTEGPQTVIPPEIGKLARGRDNSIRLVNNNSVCTKIVYTVKSASITMTSDMQYIDLQPIANKDHAAFVNFLSIGNEGTALCFCSLIPPKKVADVQFMAPKKKCITTLTTPFTLGLSMISAEKPAGLRFIDISAENTVTEVLDSYSTKQFYKFDSGKTYHYYSDEVSGDYKLERIDNNANSRIFVKIYNNKTYGQSNTPVYMIEALDANMNQIPIARNVFYDEKLQEALGFKVDAMNHMYLDISGNLYVEVGYMDVEKQNVINLETLCAPYPANYAEYIYSYSQTVENDEKVNSDVIVEEEAVYPYSSHLAVDKATVIGLSVFGAVILLVALSVGIFIGLKKRKSHNEGYDKLLPSV